MDAVAAADADRVLVLEGAALERREQRVEVGEQDVGGAGQLDREAGVEHVRGGHALVDEAGLVGPTIFGQMGQEGDDVVLGHGLDLVDAGDVEVDVLRASRRPAAFSFGITPSSACASQAWASISNQMRKRVSGDQIGDHRRGGSSAGSWAASCRCSCAL